MLTPHSLKQQMWTEQLLQRAKHFSELHMKKCELKILCAHTSAESCTCLFCKHSRPPRCRLEQLHHLVTLCCPWTESSSALGCYSDIAPPWEQRMCLSLTFKTQWSRKLNEAVPEGHLFTTHTFHPNKTEVYLSKQVVISLLSNV